MRKSAIQLSIVVCGRNDNCNGDFDERVQRALRHNEALLAACDIPHAWIFVEWNPLAGKPLLSAKVREWLPACRCYVVPAAIHATYARNPDLGMLQFTAKNVGIARASTPWILTLNADTFLSPPLAAALQQADRLDRQAVYLAPRIDFQPSALPPPNDRGLYPLNAIAAHHVEEIHPPRFFGAAGDFTLAHISTWRGLGGYFEGIRFSNIGIDVLFCRQAAQAGHPIEVLAPVFHARHTDEFLLMPAKAPRQPHHHGLPYCDQHVHIPYRNDFGWGLRNYAEQRARDGSVHLVDPQTQSVMAAPVLTMPPELAIIGAFSAHLCHSLRECAQERRVVIYGFGNEARQWYAQNMFQGLHVVGCLEDSPAAARDLPYPILSWETLSAAKCDILLIGSLWWCYDLAEKARSKGWQDRLHPAILRNQRKYGAPARDRNLSENRGPP